MYRLMWIFVEGSDDRTFVDHVLRPILEKEYDYIDVWEYAQQTHAKTEEFVRSLRSMKADYLFLADIDDLPCVTAKKEILAGRYRQGVEATRAVVVVREIESWYMAGADEGVCQKLGIKGTFHADDVTKERFRSLMPKRFNDSVVDFMTELLNEFQVDVARSKNRSFGYLMDQLEKKTGEA